MSSGFVSEAELQKQRETRQQEWEKVRTEDQPIGKYTPGGRGIWGIHNKWMALFNCILCLVCFNEVSPKVVLTIIFCTNIFQICTYLISLLNDLLVL